MPLPKLFVVIAKMLVTILTRLAEVATNRPRSDSLGLSGMRLVLSDHISPVRLGYIPQKKRFKTGAVESGIWELRPAFYFAE
jgi:hypothetical protein